MGKFTSMVLLLSLSLGTGTREGHAPEVVIILMSGEIEKGEIISVRDQTLVFSTSYGHDVLVSPRKEVRVVRLDEVREVMLPGRSHTLSFVAALSTLGCATGCLLGYNRQVPRGDGYFSGCNEQSEREGNAARGGEIGAVAGAVAGGAIGIATSRKDSVLFGPGKRDPAVLREVARYSADREFMLTGKDSLVGR